MNYLNQAVARGAAAIVSILLATACGGSTPTAPTPPPAPPSPQLSISNFVVVAERAGTGRVYRASFQVTETTGRAAATITTIRFTMGANTADASIGSPIRVPAGQTGVTPPLNINDAVNATAGLTSMTVTVTYNDDNGRVSTISSTAPVNDPG